MPLPNCPTAWGSLTAAVQLSEGLSLPLNPTVKPQQCHLCGHYSIILSAYMSCVLGVCGDISECPWVKECLWLCLINEGQVYSLLPLFHSDTQPWALLPASIPPPSIFIHPSSSLSLPLPSFSHPSHFSSFLGCTVKARHIQAVLSFLNYLSGHPRFPFLKFFAPLSLSSVTSLGARLANIVSQLWGCNQTSACWTPWGSADTTHTHTRTNTEKKGYVCMLLYEHALKCMYTHTQSLNQQVRDTNNEALAKIVHNFGTNLALALFTKGFPYYSKHKLHSNLL